MICRLVGVVASIFISKSQREEEEYQRRNSVKEKLGQFISEISITVNTKIRESISEIKDLAIPCDI